jgi:L-cysteate sulfo-lyase
MTQLPVLESLPRVRLAHLPTPLSPAPRLAAAIGLSDLWIKRDDCTGLAFGGNKVRKLEFCLAEAIEDRADCVVCGGVAQSNTARLVAAACAALGIECHLGIMRGRLKFTEAAYDHSGNMLLNRLFGAIIHDIPWNENRNLHLRQIEHDLQSMGRRPYLIPYGASNALGALGYAGAAEEIVAACPTVGWIVHATGSAGTQGGLLAGLLALKHPAKVIGIDVDGQPARVTADVRRVGRAAAALLGVEDRWDDQLVEVDADWSGGGYGIADGAAENAIRIAASLEGLVLDPVYTGKSMAGLIGLARLGTFRTPRSVVWLHTGGGPGIFAYPDMIARLAAAPI